MKVTFWDGGSGPPAVIVKVKGAGKIVSVLGGGTTVRLTVNPGPFAVMPEVSDLKVTTAE